MNGRAWLVLAALVIAGIWAVSSSSNHPDDAAHVAAAPAYAATTTAYTATEKPEIPERAWIRDWVKGAPATDEAQACLTALGYEVGAIDGVDGPKTEAALKAFAAAGPPSDDQTRACYQGIKALRDIRAQAQVAPPSAVSEQPAYLQPQGYAAPAAAYGDISQTTGLPRTEYVRGYTRKDGTQVAPYVRSHR